MIFNSQIRQSLFLLHLDVFFLATVEGSLLLAGLEPTMAQLRSSIDELQVDGLQVDAGALSDQRLSQQDETLLGTNAAALDDDEVVFHNTVVRETTQGSDILLSQIVFGGGIVLDITSLTLSNAVDSLVDFSSVEVSGLTSAGHTPGNTGRMPGSDASDFPETSVRFFLEMANSPSVHDTLESVTLGDSDNVEAVVGAKDGVNADFLFEEVLDEVDLVGGSFASVDLDFEDVVLLLSQVAEEVVLGVHDGANHSGVLADAVQLSINFGLVLGLGLVFRESFLLGLDPVFVESAQGTLVEVTGPHSCQSSQSPGSFDVSDKADNLEGRGFNDGDSLNFFLLVEFSLGTVDISEDVGHASLEASEGGEVRSQSAVISGE